MIVFRFVCKEILDQPKKPFDIYADIKFLLHFSHQRRASRLTEFDSPAGKSPKGVSFGSVDKNLILMQNYSHSSKIKTSFIMGKSKHTVLL